METYLLYPLTYCKVASKKLSSAEKQIFFPLKCSFLCLWTAAIQMAILLKLLPSFLMSRGLLQVRLRIPSHTS